MSCWALWPEECHRQVPQPRSHSLFHTENNVLFPKVLTKALRLKRGRNKVPIDQGRAGGLFWTNQLMTVLHEEGQGSKSWGLLIWLTDHLGSVLQSSLFAKQLILQGVCVCVWVCVCVCVCIWVPCGSAGPWLSRPLCSNRKTLFRDVCCPL